MKKVFALLLCSCMLFLMACSVIDAPLRNKMTQYYSDDDNYQEVTGIVKEKIGEENLKVMITTEYHTFRSDSESNYVVFTLSSHSALSEYINVGDEITLTSAPMHFYNGHALPIVALKIGGEVFLLFEEGKADYLEWIQETFG